MVRSSAAAVTLTLLAVVPAVSHAAARTGSYAGASTAKYQQYGKPDLSTDKGKVRFKVPSKRTVKNLRITGQIVQCGAGGQKIAISVDKIKLDADGKGKATYNDPAVGAFKVSITVTSAGRAKGKAVPKGLCSEAISFTAKRR